MKRIVLILVMLGFVSLVQAQSAHRLVENPLKKNITLMKPYGKSVDMPDHFLAKKDNPTVKSANFVTEATLGMTRYDLQSNQSTQNRIYRFQDGTISAVWTFGMSDDVFPDRGTGYNYFDGTSWGDEPTGRIESVRTGWPSIFAMGQEGEGFVSHDFGTPGGMVLGKRATKGTGSWSQTTIPGPVGQDGLSWPRTVSNGDNYQNIHNIAITRPTGNGGTLYQGLNGALLYSRSTDNGTTWDIANQVLPGMTSTEYKGFGGDSYAWAEPKGNTLAFVVGDSWSDLLLMKSTDNGSTWTKTVIFQHPYPLFDETTTLVLDSPYVSDGFLSAAIDNSGIVHVTFGCQRVLNDDLTDVQTSYFPYTDGLGYWNESMPAITSMNPDDLYTSNQLIGWTQDINGNDTIFEMVGIGTYYCSITSMPSMSIDENDVIYVVFTSVVEGLDNGSQNYRHIYARASLDGGATWTEFEDLTGSIIHNFHECVFPSQSARSDTHLHLVYQYDDEPGLAVRGDEDNYTDNTISYMKVPKSDLGVAVPEIVTDLNVVSQNYPNPSNGLSTVLVQLSKPEVAGLKITNIMGQLVKSQHYGLLTKGSHTFQLETHNMQPGVYFYTITLGKKDYTQRMIIE